MAALVIADHNNASIKGSALNTVTAAFACGSLVHIFIVGNDCGVVAEAASLISGVSKVLVADGEQFGNGLASQILALAGAYSDILAPETVNGKNIVPRLAAVLDIAQISEITEVASLDTVERPIYAGNITAVVHSNDLVKVITVRAPDFDAAGSAAGSEPAAPVEKVLTVAGSGTGVFVSCEATVPGRAELNGAKIVVSGRRGMGPGDNFKILEPLADRLGTEMGASRAAVDAGFVPNDAYPRPDGRLTFDRLSSRFISNAIHVGNQPIPPLPF